MSTSVTIASRPAPSWVGTCGVPFTRCLPSQGSDDCVMLDPGIYYLKSQWDLYTRASGRFDLAAHTIWLRSGIAETSSSDCRGTTALAYAGDMRFAGWPSTLIRELDGTAALAVYRR